MYSHFIGQRITQLRLEKDISEYQLSLELGLSKSYIQGITSGKSQPSVKQLLNICDYFGITPAQFFDTDPAATLLFHETVNTLKGQRYQTDFKFCPAHTGAYLGQTAQPPIRAGF